LKRILKQCFITSTDHFPRYYRSARTETNRPPSLPPRLIFSTKLRPLGSLRLLNSNRAIRGDYLLTNLEKIRAILAADPSLAAIEKVAFKEIDADPAHDREHLLRVAAWTLCLVGEEFDHRMAIAASLLHDIVNPPKNSQNRELASRQSAEFARQILPHHGFQPTTVEEIAIAIEEHSYIRGAVPSSRLGKALQDADRLDALGAIGVMRTVATGVRMGASLFDPDDPWATHRSLNDHQFTLDHFFTKLLHLPETMQTPAGRCEAETRVDFLIGYLRQLGAELGVDPPHEMKRQNS
jgi:uncharacterized protein